LAALAFNEWAIKNGKEKKELNVIGENFYLNYYGIKDLIFQK